MKIVIKIYYSFINSSDYEKYGAIPPAVHGAMGCGQKKNLSVSVAVPPALGRVPSQSPLTPSITSVTSIANDKGDNEMILGIAQIWHLPYSRGKPQKTSARRPSMKGLIDQSSPQIWSLSSK